MPIECSARVEGLGDLPLDEVRGRPGTPGDLMALYITGDGGFGVTDRGISEILSDHGIPVVSLNALKYFRTKRTPEELASDLALVLRHYRAAWDRPRAVLIGYSLGADVLPFAANRLPEDLRAAIHAVVLLGPSARTEFQFHVGDWLGRKPGPDALPVVPEIEKIPADVLLVCIYGERDEEQVCGSLRRSRLRVAGIPSGHRFGRDYEPVAAVILDALGRRAP